MAIKKESEDCGLAAAAVPPAEHSGRAESGMLQLLRTFNPLDQLNRLIALSGPADYVADLRALRNFLYSESCLAAPSLPPSVQHLQDVWNSLQDAIKAVQDAKVRNLGDGLEALEAARGEMDALLQAEFAALLDSGG